MLVVCIASSLALCATGGAQPLLWRSANLQYRPTALWELRPFLGRDDDLTAQLGLKKPALEPMQLSLLLSISVGMGGSYALQSAPLPEPARTQLSTAVAATPFFMLVGGVAFPQQLQALFRRLQRLQAGQRRRAVYHEAGHFLIGHLIGLRITGVSVAAADTAVKLEVVPGVTLDELAVTSMGGLAAELIEYQSAEGAVADLAQLRVYLARFARSEQDDRIRWATLMALTLCQNHREELDRLAAAIDMGASVEECVSAVEGTAARSRVDATGPPIER